jgi:hypothetical protein
VPPALATAASFDPLLPFGSAAPSPALAALWVWILPTSWNGVITPMEISLCLSSSSTTAPSCASHRALAPSAADAAGSSSAVCTIQAPESSRQAKAGAYARSHLSRHPGYSHPLRVLQLCDFAQLANEDSEMLVSESAQRVKGYLQCVLLLQLAATLHLTRCTPFNSPSALWGAAACWARRDKGGATFSAEF